MKHANVELNEAPGPAPAGRRRWLLWVGLGTLALHVLIAWRYPLQGNFRKYGLAAEHYLSGELPGERPMDFSALYFHLSVLAERFLPWPETALMWLQIVLVAASVALVFGLLERRVGRAWAAAASLVMALDPHLLVYARILEPEVCMLFFLLAFLWFLDRKAPVLRGSPAPRPPSAWPSVRPFCPLSCWHLSTSGFEASGGGRGSRSRWLSWRRSRRCFCCWPCARPRSPATRARRS